jgi:hypothetical protein
MMMMTTTTTKTIPTLREAMFERDHRWVTIRLTSRLAFCARTRS